MSDPFRQQGVNYVIGHLRQKGGGTALHETFPAKGVKHVTGPLLQKKHVTDPVRQKGGKACHGAFRQTVPRLSCVCLLLEEPTLRLLSMHMKYGPWKVALMDSWKEFCGVAVSRRPRDRAVRLLRALRRMCSARNALVDDKPWVTSVGRNVSHCAGALAVCLTLGVIKKIQKKTRAKLSRARVGRVAESRRPSRLASLAFLRLGVHGTCYRLCSLRESGGAVQKLQSWVALADGLGEIVAPRTCRQWISEYKRLHGIMFERRPHHIKPCSRRFV